MNCILVRTFKQSIGNMEGWFHIVMGNQEYQNNAVLMTKTKQNWFSLKVQNLIETQYSDFIKILITFIKLICIHNRLLSTYVNWKTFSTLDTIRDKLNNNINKKIQKLKVHQKIKNKQINESLDIHISYIRTFFGGKMY